MRQRTRSHTCLLVYGPARSTPVPQQLQHRMCTPCIVNFTCDLQIAQLRTMIETDQQMLIQFAEEKMALACQCFDLVDMHLMQIDRDIDTFDAEIQVG
jgi:ferredoxin